MALSFSSHGAHARRFGSTQYSYTVSVDGKLGSCSRTNASNLRRPPSSTDAPTDQMSANRNHSSTSAAPSPSAPVYPFSAVASASNRYVSCRTALSVSVGTSSRQLRRRNSSAAPSQRSTRRASSSASGPSLRASLRCSHDLTYGAQPRSSTLR